jgi:hypothetical protein
MACFGVFLLHGLPLPADVLASPRAQGMGLYNVATYNELSETSTVRTVSTLQTVLLAMRAVFLSSPL